MKRFVFPIGILLLALLAFPAGACEGPACDQTTVTQMGNVKIINSGPTTTTRLGNVKVIDSTGGPDLHFTIPSDNSRRVIIRQNAPYYPSGGTWVYVPYGGYPSSVYAQPQRQIVCDAYGCH